MDWLNRARQLLGNLFGGAQRTIGQISGNVARGVGRAEQQAARVAQQVVRQIPQPPRIQLPQIPQVQMPRFQAPRVQLPQAPKIDLAAVGQALRGFQQGVDISGRTFTGKALTPEQQRLVAQIPGGKTMLAATPRASEIGRFLRSTAPGIDLGLSIKEKGLGAFSPQAIMQRGPVAGVSQVIQKAGERIAATPEAAQLRRMPGVTGNIARYQQLQATKPSEAITKPVVGGLKTVEQLPGFKQLGQTEAGKFIRENVAKPILQGFIDTAGRVGGAQMGEKTYADGLKGYAQLASDITNVASIAYSGGLSAQLAKGGIKTFIPTAIKLAPRLAASGAGQNIIAQLAEGKKLNELNPKEIALAAGAYTALGIGIPAATKVGGAAIRKTIGAVTPTAEASKVGQTLPADKNALVIAGSLPEKGALRAQGYTNVKVQFQPKPGQVAPTMQGAIPQTAPKPSKLPIKKERQFVTSVKTSSEVSNDIRSAITGEYTPKSNQVLIDNASKLVKNTNKAINTVNEQLAKPAGKISDQEIANAIILAKKLDATGNMDGALNIYDQLAKHLTQAGRDVQAASLLSRRTPEGLLFSAQRTLKKAGVEITPLIKKELQNNIDIIKKTVVGSNERNIAIAKMQQDLVKHIPQNTLDNIVSVWKAGLLSGAKTQGGNFLSNATFGTMKLVSNPISATVDRVMSIFTGKRGFTATGRGLATGGVEGAQKGIFTLKTGIDTRNMAAGASKFDQVAEINFKNKTVQKIIGNPSNWVFRGMSAADQPFYFAALKNSLYSQALAEGKNLKLKGKALDDYLSKTLSNPTSNMLNIAKAEADKAVLGFDTILSRAVSSIHQSIDNSNLSPTGRATANAIVNFIAPFTKVPSAFLSRTIDYTPLGMGRGIFKAITDKIKTGKFDQRALAQSIGEGITGTGLIVLGAQLANADLLSGDYPKNDQKEQARWKAEGITPNSVKLGNTWVNLNYLGPLGLLFGAGKNFVDARKEGGKITDATAAVVGGFGSGLLQQSFLQGLSGFTDAINNPQRNASSFVKSFAGSFVPSWINDIANITDQYKRKATTPIEAAMARVPGLRQQLPTQTDVFGRPLETGGIQSVNPLKPSPVVSTGLSSELDRLKSINKEYNVWPTPVDNTDFFGKGTELDKKQLNQVNAELGAQIQNAWTRTIATADYQNKSDSDKADLLSKVKKQEIENYKINNDTQFGMEYTPKEKTQPKIKLPSTKVVKAKIKKGKKAKQKRVSLKAPRLRRIKVAVPKARKVSFKQPTPTKARKSIKIKTG